ncbi:MAG: HyaD/HybD family hydrogenase maturation endopeptidase [Granulosicoccaceae bacterium]
MGAKKTLILGIGNILWADEGFGVRAVEQLHAHYEFDEHVRLLDGGTQGIYLVQEIREAELLVVFDAVDYGLPGGTLKLVRDNEVPKFLGAKKVSLHQTGFQEVLAMAEMMGDYPTELLLVGVQPIEIDDYGGSLREPVRAQVQPAIEAALAYLSAHGIQSRPRTSPLAAHEHLGPLELALDPYETQRPSQEHALRTGDARVLSHPAVEFDPKPSPLDGQTTSIDLHHQRETS